MSATTPTVLAQILESTRAEVARRKDALPLTQLEVQAQSQSELSLAAGDRLAASLERPGIGVIAEFKRRSPSAGILREGARVEDLVPAYDLGGASALSVLTEGPNFSGSLDDLRAARSLTDLPILRKDFIVDEYQLVEALIAGADAVLLIVAALEPAELAALHGSARARGLEVLVEVHDRAELETAIDAGASIIGVNNRDLRDFTVDVERTARLLGEMPADVVVVSESGISTPEQLGQLQHLGVHAVLIGESLMRAPDPRHALTTLLAAARPNPRL